MIQIPARGQALAFIILTFAISWVEQFFIIRGDASSQPLRIFCLMWTPGLVALFCALLFDRGFKTLALRAAAPKAFLLAYFFPALCAVLMVALLATFSIAEVCARPPILRTTVAVGFVDLALLAMTLSGGMLFAILSALGEEIGWRGFLHSKLSEVAWRPRALLIGLVWSVWHWPLFLFGGKALSVPPGLQVLFLTLSLTGLSFFMGWLRDRFHSSLPAVLAHASHNMWLLMVAPALFIPGPRASVFAGEAGGFCALIYGSLAAFLALLENRPASFTVQNPDRI